MTRRHLLAWLVLIALLTTGCGVRPTGVITGGPAPTGRAFARPGEPEPPEPASATLYFLAGSELTPVLRRTRGPLSPTQTLVLLQQGPDITNLTSDVPTDLDPVSVTADASGNVEVVVSADVTALSADAVDQIVCTVGDALSTTAPVTLTSDAGTRGPRTCPLTR